MLTWSASAGTEEDDEVARERLTAATAHQQGAAVRVPRCWPVCVVSYFVCCCRNYESSGYIFLLCSVGKWASRRRRSRRCCVERRHGVGRQINDGWTVPLLLDPFVPRMAKER